MSLTFSTLGGAALTQGYKYYAPTAQVRKTVLLGLRPVGPLGNNQVRSAWYKQENKYCGSQHLQLKNKVVCHETFLCSIWQLKNKRIDEINETKLEWNSPA